VADKVMLAAQTLYAARLLAAGPCRQPSACVVGDAGCLATSTLLSAQAPAPGPSFRARGVQALHQAACSTSAAWRHWLHSSLLRCYGRACVATEIGAARGPAIAVIKVSRASTYVASG